MWREMRRSKQLFTGEEAVKVLERNTAGTLALSGDDGYPYAVPLSYVFSDNKLYFHSAKSGHKLDALKNSNKVSFCVIDKDEIVPERFTTYYKSVIIFGKASIVEDKSEITEALKLLSKKYSPKETPERTMDEINGSLDRVSIIRLDIEHMTGKQAIELVNAEK